MIITVKRCRVDVCEGADHKFEFDRPTAREILRIEQASGMDIDTWSDGLTGALNKVAAKPALLAMLALVDILHRRDGIKVPFEDIDVDLMDLDIELEAGEVDDDGDEAGDEAGKDPAPTKPSPRRAAGASRASTSGAAKKAASGRKSTPTPSSSGGSSD